MGYKGDYCDPRFHATYFRRGRRLYLLDKSDGGSKIELTIDTSILERRIPFDFVPPLPPPVFVSCIGERRDDKGWEGERREKRHVGRERLKEREEGKKKSMSGNVRRWRRGGGGGGSDGAVVSLFPSLTLVQQRRNF